MMVVQKTIKMCFSQGDADLSLTFDPRKETPKGTEYIHAPTTGMKVH